jgi:hypothetical protein
MQLINLDWFQLNAIYLVTYGKKRGVLLINYCVGLRRRDARGELYSICVSISEQCFDYISVLVATKRDFSEPLSSNGLFRHNIKRNFIIYIYKNKSFPLS